MSLELLEIRPGVFRSAPDPARDRPALGAILGREACLMVDAGASPAHASAFVAALRAATGREPGLVALTHWHWDHAFGLASLGLPAIARRATAERLAALRGLAWDDASLAARVDAGEEIEFCASMIAEEYGPGSGGGEGRGIGIAVPGRLFEGEERIDLGGETVRLAGLESDHAEGCLVVLAEKAGVLFTGDILGPAYYERPVLYRPARVLGLLEALLDLPAELYVDGHGEVQTRGDFLRETAAMAAVARALLAGERDRPALLRIAEDAEPEAEAVELHRLVAFLVRGAEAEGA